MKHLKAETQTQYMIHTSDPALLFLVDSREQVGTLREIVTRMGHTVTRLEKHVIGNRQHLIEVVEGN